MRRQYAVTANKLGDELLIAQKAILLNERDQILFIVMGGLLPGKYDLPGGIVGKNEASMDEALAREMREELGEGIIYEVLHSQIVRHKSHRPLQIDQDQTPIRMTASICRYDASSEIVLPCSYHNAVKWISFDEVLQHPCILSGIELLTRDAMRAYYRRGMNRGAIQKNLKNSTY